MFGRLIDKKKIASILLAAVLLPAPAARAESVIVGFLVGLAGLGDHSFNDMTYAGLIKAKQEFGIVLLLEDMEKTDAASEEAMRRLIRGGARIIVANGFNFKKLVKTYAPRHPDLRFIIHDVSIDALANVASTDFAVNEGSFLAGALAGMMSHSGKIGFIGGVDIPIMHDFRIGFHKGVLYTRPDAVLREEFVTRGPDFSGFNSPARGFEMAMAQYADGVDIIYCAAGLTGNGVLQASKKSGKFAIGVDSDQDHLAMGRVLTSMMKRLDIATYRELADIIRGEFTPGVKRYGLKEGGVGLSPMKYTRHLIPDKTLEKLREIREAIILGEIRASGRLDAPSSETRGGPP